MERQVKVEAAKQLAMQSSRLRYCRLFWGPFINYVVILKGGHYVYKWGLRGHLLGNRAEHRKSSMNYVSHL